jgi:LCP family protein required for cell wall assembly
MATKNNKGANSSGFVDISSNTQVVKLYKKKGRAVRIVAVVLAVLLMISGGGVLYYYHALDSLNYESDDSSKVATKATTIADDEVDEFNVSVKNDDLLSSPKVLNIMLFGEDNHKKGETGRSDSMIMASIDINSEKIKLTSFQRDTYVYVPGYGYTKLTHAYSWGGASLTIRTIEANFGVMVDRYAVVDFNSFKKIIDVLGGLTIKLDADEAAYINYQMYINKQTTNRHVLEEKDGTVTLTGQQALWYARDRGYEGIQAGDDWSRTSRQRKLLEKIFSDMRKASLTQIISIVSEVGPLVTTNLKKDEITGLVSHALTYINYDVKQYTVPQDGLWAYYTDEEAGSCIQITDMDKCRKKFAKFVFGSALTA